MLKIFTIFSVLSFFFQDIPSIVAVSLWKRPVSYPAYGGLSMTQQKNRSASDSYDIYDMELGSSETDWDAYFFWAFSYIVRIGDWKKSPMFTTLRTYES